MFGNSNTVKSSVNVNMKKARRNCWNCDVECFCVVVIFHNNTLMENVLCSISNHFDEHVNYNNCVFADKTRTNKRIKHYCKILRVNRFLCLLTNGLIAFTIGGCDICISDYCNH